ncbi:MAG: aminotransferase class III-fold pyridoxal phosphate-dependent enzyme [Pseudomonadota bacterium]
MPGGGVYFTRSARFAGQDVLPGFITQAQGCRITDADGRSYLDFNCGNGPNLLGYCHPEVDKAAATQAAKMDLASFFPEAMPAYAERLLQWGSDFDWTIFTKNGSDSTNLALRIMRAARQRPLVVLFKAAYHGFGVEISLSHEAPFDEEQKNILRVPWNDSEALLGLLDQYGDQIAGLMINPLDQSPLRETVGVSSDMVQAIHTFREQTGAVVALDDVRNGFRLHPQGSHVHMGLQPDLLCLGKAMANGYATSAVLGTDALRDSAASIRFTATYMFSAVTFQAGIATLDVYEREQVFDHISRMGQLLVDGIVSAGQAAGHEDIIMSGPPTMPTLLMGNDPKARRARIFARHAARLGAVFHPTLNWFLSFAHQPADIEEALDIAQEAFRQTPAQLD